MEYLTSFPDWNALSAWIMTQRTPRSASTYSRGSCEWFKHDFEVPWTKPEQILQLKVECSNFGPVRDLAVCPTLQNVEGLKETTHLRHFFENIVNNFHNTVFHSLFRNTNYFPNSWVSQNNIKYKSKFEVNRTQRYGASQSHSSCCELIGHRRATDEAVPAAGLRIV